MRTTITINDSLFKSLKMRAAESGESISSLVEEAITYQILEDVEDKEIVEKRLQEPKLSFDTLIKEFKAEGLL
jgi:hypothetical protein